MSSKDGKKTKGAAGAGQTGKKTKSSEGGKNAILQAFKGSSRDNSPSSTLHRQNHHHHHHVPSGGGEVINGGALDDEPHPQLLAKLGLLYAEQRVSHVKTVSHPHPLLKSGAIHGTANRTPQQDAVKKGAGSGVAYGATSTTSPASTLSDKGIGSSLGSFDSELRNPQQPQHFTHARAPSRQQSAHHDPHAGHHSQPHPHHHQQQHHHNQHQQQLMMGGQPKTGSLDSRTQEYAHQMMLQHGGNEHLMVNHTRSSSDIICNRPSTAASSMMMRPHLAEQSQVPLWNMDPRRGMLGGPHHQQPGGPGGPGHPHAHHDMSSLMRVRRSGNGAVRGRGDAVGGLKMDATGSGGMETIDRAESYGDVKKLPQLCIDSNPSNPIASGSTSLNNLTSSHMNEQQQRHHHHMQMSEPSLQMIKGAVPQSSLVPPSYQKQQSVPAYYQPQHDQQLMPPPPPPQKGKMLAAVGRVASDSSLGTLNGIQPGYHDEHKDPEGPAGFYARQWSNQEPPSYEHHLHQHNIMHQQPSISISNLSNSSDVTLSNNGAAGAMWEHQRPQSMSMGFPPPPPGVLAGPGQQPANGGYHHDAVASYHHHIPEARSASPSINGDETLSRRGGFGRSSTRSNPGERRVANSSDSMLPQRFHQTGHHGAAGAGRHIEPVMESLHFEIPLAVTSEVKFVGREWLYAEISQCFARAESSVVAGTAAGITKGVAIVGKAGHGKTSLVRHLVSYSYHGHRSTPFNNFRSDFENLHIRAGATSTLQQQHHNGAANGGPRRGVLPPAQAHLPPHMFPGSSRSGSAQSSRTGSPTMGGSSASSRTGSQASLGEDSFCRKLASQVVAYHFCQSSVNKTCYVPEFVSNVAAQMSRAPQLTAYRELLMREARVLGFLSMRNCLINPVQAFNKGIIEPLTQLRREQKLPKTTLIIAIDAIDESLLHKPDHGHSIFSFVEEQLRTLPDFVKIVLTSRTPQLERLQRLPLDCFTLDLSPAACETPTTPTTPGAVVQHLSDQQRARLGAEDELIRRDMITYVQYRISQAPDVLNLARMAAKSDQVEGRLIEHLTRTSEGNFLYLRMTLDLMERGHIVPKSINFKVVPQSLDEVFMLTCNQRFLSEGDFDEVRDIVAVALASLYPLTDERIYEAVSVGLAPGQQLSWVAFKDALERQLNQFLVQTAPQSGRTFFHACLKEWLMGQTGQSAHLRGNTVMPSVHKFAVDWKRGHTLLATVLSKLPPDRMDRNQTLELAHHILKADMFRKTRKTGAGAMSGSEQNAIFMKNSSTHLTEAFTSARNLFYPSIKVNKLLLRAGANANHPTNIFNKATPLAVVSHTGNVELSKLLLMFTANVDTPSANGLSPLCLAAIAGRQEVVELLLQYGPNLNQADVNGHTALLHAISRGHVQVAHVLLHCSLYKDAQERNVATQRALVAAAMTGCTQLINYVLTSEVLYCDVDAYDPVNGECALTAASMRGKTEACDVLVTKHQASLNARNRAGLTALLKAVFHGEFVTADLLLNLGAGLEDADPNGLTPLIMAAKQGHLGLVEGLITRGAKVSAVDKEGLSALSWAALQGKAPCVKALIGHGAEVDRCDVHGRTGLGMAAFRGDLAVVEMLLHARADVSHRDNSGMSALDRAIGRDNLDAVALLLAHDAPVLETTWAMSQSKPDAMALLLGRSLEEANGAYKSGRFDEAYARYEEALRMVGEPATAAQLAAGYRLQSNMADICAHLLLGYSRCQRKSGKLDESEVSSSRALKLKPQWHEALYARARVLREKCNFKAALMDAEDAERHAPQHNLKEIRRLADRIRDEMKKNGAAPPPPPPVPAARSQSQMQMAPPSEPMHMRPRSSAAVTHPDLSRSFQPQSHIEVPARMQRQRSHENLAAETKPPQQQQQQRGPVVPPRPEGHDQQPARYVPAAAALSKHRDQLRTKSQFVTDL